MLSWGRDHLGPVSVPVMRDQPSSKSHWPSKRDHKEKATTQKAELNFPLVPAELWVPASGREHELQTWLLWQNPWDEPLEGQDVQMGLGALPVDFLALSVLGDRDVSCPLSSAKATFLCPKSPCASSSSKAKGCSLNPCSDSNFVEFYSAPKPSGRD